MIEELVEKIVKYNEAYRTGDALVSDTIYDSLVDRLRDLDPNNEVFSKIGYEIKDLERKSKLPIAMASMNKEKSIQDIHNWFRLKNIPQQLMTLTPKLDGLSLCNKVGTNHSWTRGDGEYGQKSDEHFGLIGNQSLNLLKADYSYGEVIMPKSVFLDKYVEEFANPRNLVSGLLNKKEASEPLMDCVFIRYGATHHNFKTKSDLLNHLNDNHLVKIPFKTVDSSELTEDLLINLFKEWSVDFEIDGIIIEIDSIDEQNRLGRETSTNNPVWARAFKHSSFEQCEEAEILNISWNISKQGLLKPVAHITPIKLDGVTVSNVTLNNAKFVKEMGIGIGSIVKVKRSGMVIPLIVDVITTKDFIIPEIPCHWNQSGVELVTDYETDEQKIKKIISFFDILEADNFSEGIIRQLWDNGYQDLKTLLHLNKSDLESLDGFGTRKAEIVYNSIQKSVTNVQLSKVQHASGLFQGLGSKKLALLEHFDTKPSLDDVMNIEGFAEISAQSYINGYDDFKTFLNDLPITVEKKKEIELLSNDLDNKQFVFTGVRSKEMEEVITSRGGKIGSSVSKNTTHLIMKSIGSGSSKEKKAIELGIEIMTLSQLEEFLK